MRLGCQKYLRGQTRMRIGEMNTDYLDELLDELTSAQMSYDAAHEQGCATPADKRRIAEAKQAIREAVAQLKKVAADAERGVK